jgi:hypothetical protein
MTLYLGYILSRISPRSAHEHEQRLVDELARSGLRHAPVIHMPILEVEARRALFPRATHKEPAHDLSGSISAYTYYAYAALTVCGGYRCNGRVLHHAA